MFSQFSITIKNKNWILLEKVSLCGCHNFSPKQYYYYCSLCGLYGGFDVYNGGCGRYCCCCGSYKSNNDRLGVCVSYHHRWNRSVRRIKFLSISPQEAFKILFLVICFKLFNKKTKQNNKFVANVRLLCDDDDNYIIIILLPTNNHNCWGTLILCKLPWQQPNYWHKS